MTASVLNKIQIHKRFSSKERLFKNAYFASHLIFHRFLPFNCSLSFCSLTKGITPKICRLCVCILINKRSFEPFMCLDLDQNKTQKYNHFG